ncbi:hypothetical protein Ddc_18164 [Ditylenchus destructor]|nr:hypothetical protein Ddc_18164 [Ditylenchus destructor]
MIKIGTTAISAFVEFEDQTKYLAIFGDMKMRNVRGWEPSQDQLKEFFDRYTNRSREDVIARLEKTKRDKTCLSRFLSIFRKKAIGTSLSDDRKIYWMSNHHHDRSNQAIVCVAAMAGIQQDKEMKVLEEQWTTLALRGETPGEKIGLHLFKNEYDKSNTSFLVASRNAENELILEIVYVCVCVKAGLFEKCPHTADDRHFVRQTVDSWVESIGTGMDHAKDAMYTEYGDISLHPNSLSFCCET